MNYRIAYGMVRVGVTIRVSTYLSDTVLQADIRHELHSTKHPLLNLQPHNFLQHSILQNQARVSPALKSNKGVSNGISYHAYKPATLNASHC